MHYDDEDEDDEENNATGMSFCGSKTGIMRGINFKPIYVDNVFKIVWLGDRISIEGSKNRRKTSGKF